MKNYYQLLEVTRSASSQEIKKAYRKLSLRYHPDRNQGQARFNELFIQIKEAYEVLSDDSRKQHYDYALDQLTNRPLKNQQEEFIQPVIDFFYINTQHFKIGDIIEFRWKTHFADRVEIRPFGKVAAEGIKKFKIINAADIIIVELVALNTISQRYAMSTLQINRASNLKNETKATNEEQKYYQSLHEKFPGIDVRHFQKDRLLSIYGRISPKDYALRILFLLFMGYCIKISGFHQSIDSSLFILSYSLLLTYIFANTIKRLHDLGKSSKMALILLVPIINLFFICYLSYKKGEKEVNNYGIPPVSYRNK